MIRFPEKVIWICVTCVLRNNKDLSGFLQNSKQIAITTLNFFSSSVSISYTLASQGFS